MSTTKIRKVAAAEVPANRRRGGDIRVVLGPSTAGATSGFLGVLTLATGEYVSEHLHPYSEEFIYVIRGSLTVRVDGDPVELAAGEGLVVPIGTRHRVENTSGAEAEAVFHLSPLAPRPDLGHVDTEELPAPQQPQLSVGGQR